MGDEEGQCLQGGLVNDNDNVRNNEGCSSSGMAFFQPSYVIGQSDRFQTKERNRILIPLEKDYNKKVLRFPELKRDRKLHCRRKKLSYFGNPEAPTVHKKTIIHLCRVLLTLFHQNPSFTATKRASGYYADPRFKCEVFHYCHSDGTRVTIPCSRTTRSTGYVSSKDIASKACDGTELFLPLPEDLFFKPSKDTTASAFNGATNSNFQKFFQNLKFLLKVILQQRL
ncbi:uncharacterized protein CEXT_714111 [Caerostris extrusa]|uniref:Uncharacterized protein n=1 Tax=Caerostris extrusa TaxID=172846 RepID=A0AAV4N4A3_CAEEX|nr:uncharacterized protein CEXT_714111 [Caerostris extrusa]